MPTGSLCLGTAEPQSWRDEMNYMNNKQPDASPHPTQLRQQHRGFEAEGSGSKLRQAPK